MFDSEVRISVDVAMPAPPGLRYVSDDGPAIRRRRAGRGFVYLDARGRRVANPDTLNRIRALVIPPAWTDVWICAAADGHIQATGRDAKGRKQYKYHAEYREAREQTKYRAPARVRRRAADDPGQGRRTHEPARPAAREGSGDDRTPSGDDADPCRQRRICANQSELRAHTLRSEHVAVEGAEVRFHFTGKSGKQWSLAMRDRRVARIIRACQELPGQELLHYFDEDKALRAVSSGDVNAYLERSPAATSPPRISAPGPERC